jgi:hypothetical protein
MLKPTSIPLGNILRASEPTSWPCSKTACNPSSISGNRCLALKSHHNSFGHCRPWRNFVFEMDDGRVTATLNVGIFAVATSVLVNGQFPHYERKNIHYRFYHQAPSLLTRHNETLVSIATDTGISKYVFHFQRKIFIPVKNDHARGQHLFQPPWSVAPADRPHAVTVGCAA